MARRPWNADTPPPAAPSAAPNRQHRVTFLEPIFWIVVAVGTTITGRPPRRSVRARLRIRLLPWRNGGETHCLPHTVQSLGVSTENSIRLRTQGLQRFMRS